MAKRLEFGEETASTHTAEELKRAIDVYREMERLAEDASETTQDGDAVFSLQGASYYPNRDFFEGVNEHSHISEVYRRLNVSPLMPSARTKISGCLIVHAELSGERILPHYTGTLKIEKVTPPKNRELILYDATVPQAHTVIDANLGGRYGHIYTTTTDGSSWSFHVEKKPQPIQRELPFVS